MSTLSFSSSDNYAEEFKQEKKDSMEELSNSTKKAKGGKEKTESTSSVSEEDESEEYDEDEDVENDEDVDEGTETEDNSDNVDVGDDDDDDVVVHEEKGEESEDEFWHEEPEDDGDMDQLTILSREQVVHRQLALVESVAAELGRDMWEAALLLQHYNWNLDRLHSKYWDNPARIMRAAGIYLSAEQEAELGGAKAGDKKKKRKKKKRTSDGTKPKKKKKSNTTTDATTPKKKKGSGKKKKKKSTENGEKEEKSIKKSKDKDSKSPKKKKDSKRKIKEPKEEPKAETLKPIEKPKEDRKSPRKGIKLLSSRLTKIRSSDKLDSKRVTKDGKKLSRKERKELAKLNSENQQKPQDSTKGDETISMRDFDAVRSAKEREKEEQDKEPLPIPPPGDCYWMESDVAECLVCCDDVPRDELYTLPCKHGPYCKTCWGYHLGVAVQSSGAAGILNLTCMWPACPIKLTYDSFKRLGSPEDFNRYLYFWTKNYVDNNKDFSACPNPSCTNVIYFSGTGKPALLVKCTCGHQFCFACGMENHNPVTCTQLDKWQERNSDDQESLKLIMATTKRCFHCNIPTTRTDGCNHMTCRKEQGGCGGQWCWMCRGDWKTHGPHTGGFYSCNKYDTSDAKKQDDEAAKLKAESDRYLHYFERYFAHSTASKNIKDQLEKAEKKALEYAQHNNSNADFFVEAVKLLARCRHVLKYTHVYGYYLPDGSKGKDFFEYLQANAEGITERLADMVNAPLCELNIPDFKNRIRVTNEYINNLVRAMEDGLGVEGLGQMK